jgi:hypothetical protein
MRWLFFFTFCLVRLPAAAADGAPSGAFVAVYLQPGSLFSSGNYPLEQLQKKTDSVKVQKWYRVKWGPRRYAWTPEEFVVTQHSLSSPSNLNPQTLTFTQSDLPLRSAPHPQAPILTHTQRGQILPFTETTEKKWGRIFSRESGELWWMIQDENWTLPLHPTKIKTAELFSKHKIHDIASSPTLPNLKILSAQGIYRTIDGEEWEKLVHFKNDDYAVAIDKTGRIFVGNEYSDDQGETFHSFIRFESLLLAVHKRWRMSPRHLKILELSSTNSVGLQVKLDIGLKFPVLVNTPDQGRSWQAL